MGTPRVGRRPRVATAEALRVPETTGYFEVLRAATLEELAAELDISRQAVANRLQRAFRTLAGAAVVDKDGE